MTAASWSSTPSGRAVDPASTRTADPAELLRRSGRGDEAAFAELYDETSRRLFSLVLRIVRDVTLCEEVTQGVYLQIWRHSARFDPDRGSALGWIMAMAQRAAVDRVRCGPAPLRP